MDQKGTTATKNKLYSIYTLNNFIIITLAHDKHEYTYVFYTLVFTQTNNVYDSM